jgi:hypothetical protein
MGDLTLDQLAALVGEAIGLEDDSLLSEIRTAEDLDEAIRRVEAMAEDAAAALVVLRSEKKRAQAQKGKR